MCTRSIRRPNGGGQRKKSDVDGLADPGDGMSERNDEGGKMKG